MNGFDFLLTIDIFRKSMNEQQAVWRDFWKKGEETLEESGINLMPLPAEWTTLKHNYFSVLFIAAFFALKIPLPRLKLYARLNHCLRVWVTACDNLLDNELKEMILTDLPEYARVFKSAHTILVADRIFFSFLIDAVKEGTITLDEMEKLIKTSLNFLSASGREEAEEECGVNYSFSPNDVLYKIHYAKTGLLFASPLGAPMILNDISDKKKADSIKEGLCHFGLGCQILDDLSDIGMDLYYKKHNYLATLVMHGKDNQEKQILLNMLDSKLDDSIKEDAALSKRFPRSYIIAEKEALSRFQFALEQFCEGGLPFNKTTGQTFIKTLMAITGHPNLLLHLRKL